MIIRFLVFCDHFRRNHHQVACQHDQIRLIGIYRLRSMLSLNICSGLIILRRNTFCRDPMFLSPRQCICIFIIADHSDDLCIRNPVLLPPHPGSPADLFRRRKPSLTTLSIRSLPFRPASILPTTYGAFPAARIASIVLSTSVRINSKNHSESHVECIIHHLLFNLSVFRKHMQRSVVPDSCPFPLLRAYRP